ncbi:hypothetical protein SKAU_G00155670 [Synaphobranchus kaupii]|uniref:Uncharacterized protein n=1 Tax=Synaphobranchus kaupii TaxID=118154 RepID=A0A9Q1IZE4_SYNKA|nr:hypothetical protein SKAU_G00155670 [Synaphobranchus kaupii]
MVRVYFGSILNHGARIRAANGLGIPYLGYLELDVQLCGPVRQREGLHPRKRKRSSIVTYGFWCQKRIERSSRRYLRIRSLLPCWSPKAPQLSPLKLLLYMLQSLWICPQCS